MNKLLQIKNHYKKVDRVIYKVMVDMDLTVLPTTKTPRSYFLKLCREIIGQQLASKAANTILIRFYNLFPDKKITPERILDLKAEELRNVGMSWAKARYIKDLALQTKNGTIDFSKLHTMKDNDVINELIKVKGIGKWTAEMFLIFTLGREDIFSFGDLSLKRAMQKVYGFKDKPTEKEIEQIITKWTPYKSYGCLALWGILDNN